MIRCKCHTAGWVPNKPNAVRNHKFKWRGHQVDHVQHIDKWIFKEIGGVLQQVHICKDIVHYKTA